MRLHCGRCGALLRLTAPSRNVPHRSGPTASVTVPTWASRSASSAPGTAPARGCRRSCAGPACSGRRSRASRVGGQHPAVGVVDADRQRAAPRYRAVVRRQGAEQPRRLEVQGVQAAARPRWPAGSARCVGDRGQGGLGRSAATGSAASEQDARRRRPATRRRPRATRRWANAFVEHDARAGSGSDRAHLRGEHGRQRLEAPGASPACGRRKMLRTGALRQRRSRSPHRGQVGEMRALDRDRGVDRPRTGGAPVIQYSAPLTTTSSQARPAAACARSRTRHAGRAVSCGPRRGRRTGSCTRQGRSARVRRRRGPPAGTLRRPAPRCARRSAESCSRPPRRAPGTG